MEKVLQNTNWHFILNSTDPNESTNIFLNHLIQIASEHTLIKPLSSSKRKITPWITTGLIRSIRKRDKIHNKLRKYPNDLNLQNFYYQYRNICNKILKAAKRKYDKNLLNNSLHKTKLLWQNIKTICNVRNDRSNSCLELLNPALSPQESVNNINTHFASVGASLAKDISNNVSKNSCNALNSTRKHSTASSFVLHMVKPSLRR